MEKEEGGDLQTALFYAQEALARAQEANAFDILPAVWNQMARVLARTGKYAEALLLCEQVLDACQDNQAAADALLTRGICQAETNDLSGGQISLQKAAEISQRIGYSRGQGRALHNLAAGIYAPRGQFTLALATMEESHRLKALAGEQSWGLPFLQAHIFETLGNRRRARQALDELLPMVHPATRVAGGYYYLWARLALDEQELDRAEEYLRLALRIATSTGAPDLNVWVRIEYSHAARLRGEPAAARTWAENAVEFARQTGYEWMAGQALVELAQACYESGNIADARKFLSEAEELLTRHQAAYDLARIRFLRAAWRYQQSDPGAEQAWLEASAAILQGGFAFILERERDLAFPLVAGYLRSRNPGARQAAEAILKGLSRVTPPPLRVCGLGEFSVWQGRRLIPEQNWQRRRAGELFRFLLLQPGYSAGRDLILEALWPDHPPEPALDLLHQATSTLRHLLEPDLPDKFPSRYLSVEGERISLLLPEGSQVDFETFEYQLPLALRNRKLDLLESTLAMYRSDLFPGDRYSDWCAARREHLLEIYLRAMIQLGQLHLDRGNYFAALECSRKVTRRDPWSEDAVLLGMQAYQGLNDSPHALGLYRELERTLKEELDLAPRSDLTQLAESFRQNRA